MTYEDEVSKVRTWQDAVAAAHGDMKKAQEIWAEAKSAGGTGKSGGGSKNQSNEDDYESEWISEQKELDELLMRAGVGDKKRRRYIVDMFYNTEDFDKLNDPSYLNSVLRVAKVSADKRRMVLMAWFNLDEYEVDDFLKRKPRKSDSRSYSGSFIESDDETMVTKDPISVVDEQIARDLELKRKKLELKRAMMEMKEIEEELYGKKEEEPKKVKVPLKDRYGNIMKDADGKPIYVFIDPQEEYEMTKFASANAEPEHAQSSAFEQQMQIMMQMMQQQQEFMMQLLINKSNDEGGSSNVEIEMMKQMLEQMKQDKQQTEMTLNKLQQELEKKKREEMEERINQLYEGLSEVYKSVQTGPKTPIDALEEVRKLRMEYPELFGGKSPEDIRLEMDLTAMKNSFELAKDNHELMLDMAKDFKELYKQKSLNDMKLQALKEEAELRAMGVIPQQATSEISAERLKKIEEALEDQ